MKDFEAVAISHDGEYVCEACMTAQEKKVFEDEKDVEEDGICVVFLQDTEEGDICGRCGEYLPGCEPEPEPNPSSFVRWYISENNEFGEYLPGCEPEPDSNMKFTRTESRAERLRRMEDCLRSAGRDGLRAQELANIFNVTVRTIFRDLNSLRRIGRPIRREKGINYIDPWPKK